MVQSPKIHVWLPGLFDYKGGIQVYSEFFVRALEQVLPNDAPRSGALRDRHIFLKNDRPQTHNLGFNPQTQLYFAGQWDTTPLHTLFFSLQVLIAAIFNRPNLIICGHVNFSPLAAKISALVNIPYWVIAHGVDVWYINNSSTRHSLTKANLIIAVSDYTRQRLLKEQPIPAEKIHVLPNTFRPEKFSIAPKPKHLLNKFKLTKEQPVILTVTRLAYDNTGHRTKGYDEIIEAFPSIISQIPDVRYILVGKGDDQPRIEQLIKKLNLQDHVFLAGYVSDEELPEYFQLCDLYAMPSRGEGFGIVFLEAMASGKPCLGGGKDGAISALRNGELGVLVDPDDLTEISTTIIQILQKNYPLPILYQPEILRQKVIDIYGFEQFKQNLARLLLTQFNQ